MKQLIILLCWLHTAVAAAQTFDTYFADRTLRVDYQFCGNAAKQEICIDELHCFPTWAGRRHHLSELPLGGNGEITMKDLATKQIIYRTSFSTLFQEWLTTEEARTLSKGFENTFLLPFPLNPCEITVSLKDSRRNVIARLTHTVMPDDILIHRKGTSPRFPYRYLVNSGKPADCIDVAILGEGYTSEEEVLFFRDAEEVGKNLFAHDPFKSLKDRFNIVAVASSSKDSGVSIPREGNWKETAFGSHFDTFYSERYLTTNRVKKIHDALEGIPYEHIIILANTDTYGGGGIYNAFTLTTAHHGSFGPVVVHEFGHSFAGLADEYFYEGDLFSDSYPFDTEPWEKNITTLVDFDSKWKDLLPGDESIPTPPNAEQPYRIGVYEGAGYSAKGVYRPAFDCRMRSNQAEQFCPACQRAIRQLIEFYTE